MNVNVWNIKEMLNTPTATGPNKFSIRSSAPSDYSSLSDSQLLFSSQFCPENVQLAAAPLDLGTQLGQHNSQDSEPSIFTKYQTKPQLFDEETKEKGLLNFGAGRVKSILENFEVNKNKIKDKYDRYLSSNTTPTYPSNWHVTSAEAGSFWSSEVLSTYISSIKDKLQGLQAYLDKFGEMIDTRNQSILVHLETLSKTLQDALQSHCGSVLKALTDKSQVEQALLEMERRLAAKDMELLDVKSSVQLLKEGLESLPAQLSDQHLKLREELGLLKLPNTLAELHKLMSSTRAPLHVADNSSQTSPGPCQGHALAEQNTHCPCCQAGRGCSSLGQCQTPCTAVGEQHGDSPVRNQVAGDGTSLGGKVSTVATAVCGRENSLQEAKHSLGTESCGNRLCVCCTKCHSRGSSQKRHCPEPQEGPLPTPLRKAVRRSARGVESMVLSRQRQPQVSHLSVQTDTPGQGSSNWDTDCEVQNAAGGNKAKHRPGRIPWNKAMGRKKMCPALRKGELPRCADGGLKQRKANRVIELESSRKNSYPGYTVALSSGSSTPAPAAPSQQIQPRLRKNFPPVPCSNKSLHQLADRRKRSLEIKKRPNVSSVKRNLWDSSPQENIFSLCSTRGEKQMSCFSLQSPAAPKKPHSVTVLAQQNTASCSLVLDSDYSD